MTSTTQHGTSGAISTRAARLAMVAIITYQLLLIVLIFLRPDLAPGTQSANGPSGPTAGLCQLPFLFQDRAIRLYS